MNKIRFAVVGVHSIAKHHIDGIKKLPQAELAAVCDIHEEYAKARAAENGLDKYYLDYDKMLADGGFDCVVICTPDQVHAAQAVKALEAGYHVLCEKPLAMKMEDVTAIVAAAKKANKKFMVGQVCRKTPAFIAAKQLVEAGELGQLFMVESEYAHNYDIIEDIDGWRRDPVNLRYPIVGGGCHAMDLLRWIAGDPTEVFAYANHKMLPMIVTEDATIAVLKFPNDVIGKIYVSTGCKRPYTMRTQLYGSKGTLLYESGKDYVELYTLGEDGIAVNPTPELVPVERQSHNRYGEFCDLAKIIDEDLPVAMSAEEGAKSIATCLAIVESTKTGLPVKPDYNF